MIARLDQFPPFPSLVAEEVFQPAKASRKGIVGDEALARLVATDVLPLPARLTWQFMDRNLIFPLDHDRTSLR